MPTSPESVLQKGPEIHTTGQKQAIPEDMFSTTLSHIVGVGVVLCWLLHCSSTAFGMVWVWFYPRLSACDEIHLSTERRLTHYCIVLGLLFILPFIISSFCYYIVAKTVRRHNLEVIPSLENNPRETRITSREIHISNSLFVVILAFMICWKPGRVAVLLFRFGVSLPTRMQMIFPYLIYTSCAINPFIYAGMSKAFRKEMWNVEMWNVEMWNVEMWKCGNVEMWKCGNVECGTHWNKSHNTAKTATRRKRHRGLNSNYGSSNVGDRPNGSFYSRTCCEGGCFSVTLPADFHSGFLVLCWPRLRRFYTQLYRTDTELKRYGR